MVRMTVAATESWNLELMGFCGDMVIASRMTPWLESYGQRNGIEVAVHVGLADASYLELTRLVIRGRNDAIERIETELKTRFDSQLYVTRTLPYFYEILHPHGGKAKALAWMAESMGIDQQETISFGNGYNDVQMLEWSGLGVAMDGTVSQALVVADTVAPSVR